MISNLAFRVFLESSELYWLNQAKHIDNASVELRSILEYGLELYSLTDGIFNITAGGVLTSQGYGKGATGELAVDPHEAVRISEDSISLRDDTVLDFGGFGKGYLVDLIIEHLKQRGATQATVNGGGDIRVFGSKAVEIPLMKPDNPKQYFTKVGLENMACASSSPLYRRWGSNNHLVDAQGKSYKGGIQQLTIVAKTCALADALATACMFSEDPFALAASQNIECLIAYKDGTYTASEGFPLT